MRQRFSSERNDKDFSTRRMAHATLPSRAPLGARRRAAVRIRPAASCSGCGTGSFLVRDVMHKDVLALRRDTPLYLCALRMLSSGLHSAPVVDEHNETICVGVLSQTDLLSLSSEVPAAQPDLARLQYRNGEPREGPLLSMHDSTANDAMSTINLITVRPDLPISEAAKLMLQHGVHMLPVTREDDANGKSGAMVGVVTRTDILHAVLARASDTWAAGLQNCPVE